MRENVIGMSSYSEAMDFSDMEDSGYNKELLDHALPMQPNNSISTDTNSSPAHKQDPPVKIKKKPGRKPNPASPALRKAQNRAAQRAFRERKERHMKDLETNVRGIREERDKLLQENKKFESENEILKAENWYLKGIVLSLQLVCLQHNLVIPKHCPHVNDQTLSVLAQSIPESIASYLHVNSKNQLPMAQKILDQSSNASLAQQHSILTPPNLIPGSVVITKDGVHTVPDNKKNNVQQSWHPTSMPTELYQSSYSQDNLSMPPLSPVPEKETTETQLENPTYPPNFKKESSSPRLMGPLSESVTSNLAAIQTLRLRLRLQSACIGMRSSSFTIEPTLLQLSIPHDPRIDLIPTSHMRDRMIIYRDQFDLDDCFRLLLGGSVFHGGDPAVAGNWELPSEFFEKYWFLTIDYNLRRSTNEWRKKQGLKELQPNIALHNDGSIVSVPSNSVTSSPPTFQYQQMPSQQIAHQRPIQQDNSGSDNLSNYFGLHMNIDPHHTQPLAPQQQVNPSLMPVQLTNGYRMTPPNDNNTNPRPPSQAYPLHQESFLRSKNYNMMLTGMYNSNSHNINNFNNE